MPASPPNPAPPPRDLLARRYRLLDPLGSGGSASVYRAWDERLSDFRAVKILDGSVAHNPRIRKRLLQEAEVMARLQHPNVVTLHHAGSDGSQLYLVMELMPGGSMMERLAEDGALPPRMAARVLGGVLSALQLAHDSGIVHRDVKPHNILMDGQGTVKVTDFGIARLEDGGLTRTGAVLGTLAYMPPEQKLSARSVDPRADLYAVGATLYALLTRRLPHDLYAAGFDPAIAHQLFAGIHPSLVEIIRRATAFRAEDRYPSALAMQEALARAEAELPEDPPDALLLSPRRLGRARSRLKLGPTLLGRTEPATRGEQSEITSSEQPTTVDASSELRPPRGRAPLGVGVLGMVVVLALAWSRLEPAEVRPDPSLSAEALPPLREVRPLRRPPVAPVPGIGSAPAPAPAPVRSRRPSEPPPEAPAPEVPAPEPPPPAPEWTIEQWPTGRSRSDVIATLPSDTEILDPGGRSIRPELVLRCSARHPIAALRTGLSEVDAKDGVVSVQITGGFVQRLAMEPDPSLRGELLFPRPADGIRRIIGSKEPIRFAFRAGGGPETNVVFTVGDTERLAAALTGCR